MTATSTPQTDWTDPDWQATALDWVGEQLARRVTGPVEPRVRPWSLVWRVPTDAGPVWFKANNPGTRHEAAVLAELARLAPGPGARPARGGRRPGLVVGVPDHRSASRPPSSTMTCTTATSS